MANTDKPSGFKPVGHYFGLDWTASIRCYYVGSSDSTAIYKYDMVRLNGSSDSTGIYADVDQAAATESLLGSAVGFSTVPQIVADPSNLTRLYRPASTAMYVYVVTDPFVIYEAQEDSVGGSIAAASVSLSTDITVGTGSTTTGLSAMELDSSDVATAAGQMRLLGRVNREDNALGNQCKWLCMINGTEHQLVNTTDV